MKTHRAPPVRHTALLLASLLAAPLAPSLVLADVAPPASPTAVDGNAAATIDLNRTDAVTLRLRSKEVTDAVEAADHAGREAAIKLAKLGGEEGRAIAATLRAGARTLSDDDRQDVEQAITRSEQARQRLNAAISLATESTESRWGDLREELADRYEQYAAALEEAREAAVSGGVTFETQSSLVAPAPEIPAK